MRLDPFLGYFDGVSGSGRQFTARCPAHEDRRNSLSIGEGDDGRILVHCHAGCPTTKILGSVGLTERDLFNDIPSAETSKRILAVYDYQDEQGKTLFQVVRFHPKDFRQRRPDGNGGYIYNVKDVRRVLYRLPELIRRVNEPIYIVEGEKDADRLHSHGLLATTNPGGAGKWLPEYSPIFQGRDAVVVPDKDDPGQRHAVQVAEALVLTARTIRVVDLPGEGKDVSDWLDAGHTVENLLELGGKTAAITADQLKAGNSVFSVLSVLQSEDPWEPPIPFDDEHLPPFPVQALPEWMRLHVEAVARSTQTPPDLAGMLELCACAAAGAKKAVVLVRDDYSEPLNIYVVVVLPPGERKSAVFATVVEPIEQYEEQLIKDAAPKIAEAETAIKIKELDLADAQKATSRANFEERDQEEQRAMTLARERAEMEMPKPPRLLVDDITPEKLASTIADQDGRIALMSAEGGIFDIMKGRYSSNNANLDVFLKGHSGDTLKVDRIGRLPEFVKDPALTMALTVQPDVIQGLLASPSLRGRGLLARIGYSLPRSLIGHRKINPPGVPPEVNRTYQINLFRLLTLPFGTDAEGNRSAHVLRLTSSALDAIWDFSAEVEPKLADFGELSGMRDWAGKLVGLTVRLSGILHLASNVDAPAPWAIPIERVTVERAILLGRYLTDHARAVLAKMGADPVVEQAKYILSWGEKRGHQPFSVRDLWQSARYRFDCLADLDTPLDLLVQHRYIRQEPAAPRPHRGQKRSPTYSFNPEITPQKTQKTHESAPAMNSASSAFSMRVSGTDDHPVMVQAAPQWTGIPSEGVI